jgi:hypothetical protein
MLLLKKLDPRRHERSGDINDWLQKINDSYE